MVIQERASGSQSPPVYEEMEIGNVVDGDPRKWERSVTEGSEYAWDDVNDMELPLDLVKKARKEEMEHMKGKIFKGGKEVGGLGDDKESSNEYEMGGYRQDPWHGRADGALKVVFCPQAHAGHFGRLAGTATPLRAHRRPGACSRLSSPIPGPRGSRGHTCRTLPRACSVSASRSW